MLRGAINTYTAEGEKRRSFSAHAGENVHEASRKSFDLMRNRGRSSAGRGTYKLKRQVREFYAREG